MIWHRGSRCEGRVAEACKYFAFSLQSLSEGRKMKVAQEGQRREDELISHGRRSGLNDGFRVGRARLNFCLSCAFSAKGARPLICTWRIFVQPMSGQM